VLQDKIGESELATLMTERATLEKARVVAALDPATVEASVQARVAEINKSLDEDSEDWKKNVPGKQLLARFAASANIDLGRLKNLYVREVENNRLATFDEIISIFDSFAR
jgi:hypothetical protein